MPKGLTKPSSPLQIGFNVNEAVPGTMAQGTIDLQLNVLDQEVFVVTGVDLDVSPPEAIAGTDTRVRASLSTTTRATIGDLNDPNVIAAARDDIRAAGFVDGGVAFSTQFGESPAVGMDYLAIIATNDFFVQVEGNGNAGLAFVNGKLYGYRAVADANTFSALVQSELLSA
jgi:hypothetical protein